MNKIHLLILILISLHSSFAFAHEAHHTGSISFPTSGTKTAQPCFESGVSLLHSFEYQEARDEFQEALKKDPNFVMAIWGIAMTYNHPLWNEQDQTQARKVLFSLGATDLEREEKAKTPREKGFIHAINLLYGAGNKKERDLAYANAMHQLYSSYPHDDEIALFYALSLFGTTEGKRNINRYMQAAGISENIFKHNPYHPGVLHYLIHAYDDPEHAPLGVNAAKAYATVAPDASHALHMPSHIFLALGLWDDVIASNLSAWNAATKHNPSANPGKFTIDDLHAAQWLNYGYLEKKKFDKSYRLTKEVERIAIATQSPMAVWYYTYMRAAYLIASKNWHADLASIHLNNLELSAQATNVYVNALIAIQNNKSTNEFISLLKTISDTKKLSNDTYTDYFTASLSSGVKVAGIVLNQLKGMIALSHHDFKKALQFFKLALKQENSLPIGYGPPIPIQPSAELVAFAYIKLGQSDKAKKEYLLNLKRMPHRVESEEGLKSN